MTNQFDRRHDRAVILLGSLTITLATTIATAGGFAGFDPATRLTVGPQPVDVSAIDLNHDGRDDLAVLNQANDSLASLQGRGDGTFDAPVSRQTISDPKAMALADFDGDQRPDAAIVSASSTQLAIHLNQGDGSFGGAALITMSAVADNVVTGDFNGDGHQDLFVSHINALRLTLLFGNGSGSFEVARTIDVPYYPWSIEAVEANGDQATDLGIGLLSGGQSNAIRMLLSDGQGGLLDPVDTQIVRQPVDLAFGDFNRDEIIDCATIDRHGGSLTTLFGVGNGTFADAQFHSFPGQPEELVVVDVNDDGIDDVVAVHSYFARITTLISVGDGRFLAPLWQAVLGQGMDISHGDFDGDGFQDVVTGHSLPGAQHASVLINRCTPGSAAELLDVRAVAGEIMFGPIEDIQRPDGAALWARARPVNTHHTYEYIDLRITAQTLEKSPASLNLTILSHTNQIRSIQQLRLLNHQTQRFDVILQFESGQFDQVRSILGIDAAPYVGQDGMIELSLRQAAPPTNPTLQFQTILDWIEVAVE